MRRPEDITIEEAIPDLSERVVAAPEGIIRGDLGSGHPAARIEQAGLVRGVSLWQDAWKRLRRNRLAVAGGILVLIVLLLAIAGPWLVFKYNGFTYETQDLTSRLA
ncbi:MAG TPA: hypothetical protein VFQ92_18065, partial [Blastocatellia bacterium]|nr:hypothetical protein [Blastocatellia bacterium]